MEILKQTQNNIGRFSIRENGVLALDPNEVTVPEELDESEQFILCMASRGQVSVRFLQSAAMLANGIDLWFTIKIEVAGDKLEDKLRDMEQKRLLSGKQGDYSDRKITIIGRYAWQQLVHHPDNLGRSRITVKIPLAA